MDHSHEDDRSPLCPLSPEEEATEPEHPNPDAPLVVSYGSGVDSTALLVGLHRRGVRPDLIVFADPGSEWPESYEVLLAVSRWVASVWPGLSITVVRTETVRAPYSTLEGNCLANDTLPTFAFGGHTCSSRWKQEPIDKYVASLTSGPVASALRDGRPVVRAIGYDDSKADRCRFVKASRRSQTAGDSRWVFWYPLQDWGWERERCKDEITSEEDLAALLVEAIDQPYPVKSSCWFCPAARPSELEHLARTHPDLAIRAAVLEYRARTGKHGLDSVQGLGLVRQGTPKPPKGKRNYSWTSWWLERGLLPENWQTIARDRGLIPYGWEVYSVECRPARERVAEARDTEAQAIAALPTQVQGWLQVKRRKKDGRASYGVKTKARREVEAKVRPLAESQDPTAVLPAWLAAVAEREAAEKALKQFKAPDWRDTKQPDPEHWPRLLPLARR